MPLTPGKGRAVVSRNISEMVHAGYPQRQAVAASLANAERHPRANGGAVDPAERAIKLAHHAARQTKPVAKLAAGGMPEIPYFERQEARNVATEPGVHPGGLVASPGPGRTDIHNVNVAAGSYVLPADVVSGLGEGNTLAGASVVDKMMSTGPYGTHLPRMGHGGHGAPHPPTPFHDEEASPVRFQPPHFAEGGASGGIPIVIAGGEYVVTPDAVAKLGGGDLKRGHRVLDAFVLHVRKKTVKTLKKLPGPVK